MSVEIIQFIARPRDDNDRTDFPAIAFSSALLDDAIDHADAVQREHSGPNGGSA